MVSIVGLYNSLIETIENLGTLTIISVIVIISILIFLIIIEKRLREKVIIKKSMKQVYLDKLNNLKRTNPNETINELSVLAKSFFKERFNLKKSLGYSELEEIFKKQKKKDLAEFSSRMNELLYSEETINRLVNNELTLSLKNLIEKYSIIKQDIKPLQKKKSIKNLLKKKSSEENSLDKDKKN